MAKMMVYTMPADEKLLASVGKVAVRHSQMDHAVRMVIKSLCDVTPDEALDATMKATAGQTRERVEKLARRILGDGTAFVRLQALLNRGRVASEQRNELLHNVWGGDLEGQHFVRGDDRKWNPVPQVSELDELEAELHQLAEILNWERQHGFLAAAIAAVMKEKAPRS